MLLWYACVLPIQAAFTHFKPSVSYNAGPGVGSALLALTYFLDLVLVADIVVSTKRAVQTPTGDLIEAMVVYVHVVQHHTMYLR